MAYLYQLIRNVPGLSGSDYDRQRQLYEKLGSPQGPYKGTYQQNVFLINKINDGSAAKATQPKQQAPAPAPTPQPGEIDKIKEVALANSILKEEIPFSELTKFDDKYFNEQLVKDAITKYLQPEFEREDALIKSKYDTATNRANEDYTLNLNEVNANDGFYRTQEEKAFMRALQSINQGFANSGAFFGGARTAQVGQTSDDRNEQLAEYLRKLQVQKQALLTSKDRYLGDLGNQKEQEVFNTNRERGRLVDTKVQDERDVKYDQYLRDEKEYYKNPKYKTAGYAT